MSSDRQVEVSETKRSVTADSRCRPLSHWATVCK